MTPRFQKALAFTLPHETEFRAGHYGNLNFARAEHDPNDPGGTTKFGIDQRSHPGVDIENLTLDQAKQIYWREWLQVGAEDMPSGYGEVLFDIHVNGGDGPKMLQRALASVGAYKGAIDGQIGPMTRAAMLAAGNDGLAALLRQRQRRYDTLARQPRFRSFIDGWTNRNDDLAASVGVIA